MIDEFRILADCEYVEEHISDYTRAVTCASHVRALLAERKLQRELLTAVLPTLDDLAKKKGLSYSEAEGMALDIRKHLEGGQP